MTRSIDRLTGRDDCREAVLTHRHPAWAGDNRAWAIMVVVVVVLGELDLRWPTPEQTALADGGHVVQVSYQGPHEADVLVGGLGSQPVRRRSIRTTTGWILADPAIGA